MPQSSNARVRKRREAMRAAGLRPVQIWVPDSRRAGFAETCRAQARAVAAADAADPTLATLLDAALEDLASAPEP